MEQNNKRHYKCMVCGKITDKPGKVKNNPLYDGCCSVGSYIELNYYTPEIEEFHIGFECEYFNIFSNTWVKTKIDSNNYYADEIGPDEETYIFIEDHGKPLNFRVKYLDKSDIEDIVHINNKDYSTKFKLRDTCVDELVFQTYWIEEKEFLNEDYIYWDLKYNRIKITHKSKTLFIGYIKNKSELIKLFKQLNI